MSPYLPLLWKKPAESSHANSRRAQEFILPSPNSCNKVAPLVNRHRLLLLPLLLLAASAHLAAAGNNLNWNANSNSLIHSGNWKNESNQADDPTDNNLVFDISSEFNVSLTASINVRSMLFTGNYPAYVFNSNNGSVLGLSNGITMSAGSSQTITFQSGIGISLNGSQSWEINNNLIVAGPITGSFGITKTGPGTLTLSGANTFTGGFTLNNGTLLLGSSSSGNVTSGPVGTGTLTLGNGTKLGVASGAGPVTIANAVSLDSGGSTNVTFDTANGNLTLSGVVSGAASLTKTAGNTLTLSGSNTYTGGTIINGGTLSISSVTSLGNSTGAASNLVIDGGTLAFTGSSGATNRLFTIGTNGGAIDASGSVTLTFTNGGNIALSGTNTARTLKLTGTNSGYLYSVLGDNGTGKTSLIKDGTGTWTLANASTYTGSTTINAGTLQYQTSNALSSLTDVIVASGANLGLSYYDATIGSLAGAGTVTMNGGEGSTTLTIGGSNQTTTFSGTITGTSSNKLEKTGTGTFTLSGANTYARGTEIKGGMLVAGNNQAFGSGSVTLNGGGLSVASGVTVTNTLIFSGTANVLAGNGTIGTAITANGHNVLSPGNLIGKLTFSAGLTLASGSAISFQIQDATGAAGTGYDLITVTGGVLNLTATSNTITFNLNSLNSDGNAGAASNFNPNNSYNWTFANSPNANITGFNPNQFHLVNNFTNATGAGTFNFTQSLNQRSLFLSFTPVPEPSTWLMLGSGLGALALKFRRRRSV